VEQQDRHTLDDEEPEVTGPGVEVAAAGQPPKDEPGPDEPASDELAQGDLGPYDLPDQPAVSPTNVDQGAHWHRWGVYIAAAGVVVALLAWLIPREPPPASVNGPAFPPGMAATWTGELAPTSIATESAPHAPWPVTIRLDRDGKGTLESAEEACDTELVWKGAAGAGKQKFELRVPADAACHNSQVDLGANGGVLNAWLDGDDRLGAEVVVSLLGQVVSSGTLRRV
jgi:hypothetical protein